MFKKTCLALLLASFSHLALADQLTFKSLVAGDYLALQMEDPSERDQYLEWAKAFVNYRKLPLTPEKIDLILAQGPDNDVVHKDSEDLVIKCGQDRTSNVFCPIILYKATPSTLVTPKSLRDKYYDAILKLDAVKMRPLNCKASSEALQAVAKDPKGIRLKARALYWLWVCATVLKNDKARSDYKEELWRRFPLDHHTFLVLTAEKDGRILERIHDDTDLAVIPRSETAPQVNSWIKALEALFLLKQGGSAVYVADIIDSELRKPEPEVRLYIAGLMARVARKIPSVLPASKIIVPLIADRPDFLNQSVAQALFPFDYPLYDSLKNEIVPAGNLISDYHDHIRISLFAGLIYYESGFNPKAGSTSDAIGLTQIVIGTATEEYRLDHGDPAAQVTRAQLLDPRFNLTLGSAYLERLKASNKGSWSLALAAYNQGPTTVRKWLDANPKIKDPQVLIDLLLMKESYESHASDYTSSVLGKGNWYASLYQN